MESLENRVLLAADLVAHSRADDLNPILEDQATVAHWTDSVGSVEAVAAGQPHLIKDAAGGRSVLRFDPADGIDSFQVDSAANPLSGAEDFSVAVAFRTDSPTLQGGQAEWYANSGLVDTNVKGITRDWGLSINASGQLAAGMGAGLFQPVETIYSTVDGLHDGQVHVGVLTRSLGELTLYVDGVAVGATSSADEGARAALDLVLGRSANQGPGFEGDLAQVHLYDGQLSALEVATLSDTLVDYYSNSAPEAVADEYTFDEDPSLLEGIVPTPNGVLRNDTDADDDVLSAILVSGPSHGSVQLNADGSFFYAPDANFFGVDSFRYVARDFRDSAPATVTLQVNPVYDPPEPVADRYKSLAGNLLTIDATQGVLANDQNADQAPLQSLLEQDVSDGQLDFAPDGSFTYDPQGFSGQISFTYRIDDGVSVSDPTTVLLVINTIPVAQDDEYSLEEDLPLTASSTEGVLANDIDAEFDPLTVQLIETTEHGELSLAEDGSFVYTPAENYSGPDRFTYQVTDGEDTSALATVTLDVRSVNDVPSAVEDVYFALADQTIQVPASQGLLVNDSDVEQEPLTCQLVAGPEQGSLHLAPDGSFSYTPPDGFTGTARFTYQADDGHDRSPIATVQIAINSLQEQQQVVINEVHVDPDDATELVEFIELYNQGSGPVDLSGWTLRRAVDYTLPVGTSIAAGGYIVVTQDTLDFADKFDGSAFGPWNGRLRNEGDTIELWTAAGDRIDEVDYQLGFPWPTVGDEPGPSMQLVHPSLANDLGGSWRSAMPTPGRQNTVFSTDAAPQMRRVDHSPQQPNSDQEVIITARVTDPDGVQRVELQYQLVDPGDYVAQSDPRYTTQWTTIVMRDDGQDGDERAADDTYTAVVPAELQVHRRLVRYRISATDAQGNARTAPYEDDPQPNFAYYVYDGIPDWTGAARPGTTPEVTYDGDLLNSIPVYQLITTRESHEDAMFIPDSTRGSGYTGSDYLWEGTLIYDGVVYDHIHYRARGGVWRYAMGKNMWKFDFNRGHSFQARDDYGRLYDTQWDKLNFSAIIQQGNFLHRGEQGLFESVGFKLFNLAGTESPYTNYVHFRIVENASEEAEDQYSTDFQGMYLVIEQSDGRMLDEHGLPDGNFYKIEGNAPESIANQGPYQVSNRSDARDFIREFTGSRRPEEQWWRDNLDLERYYGYQAISEAIHHYDTAFGKNFYYFNNPETGRWQIHPWDLDLTWADNMFGNAGHEFNVKVAKNSDFNHYVNEANIDLRNRLNHEYQNRVREIRDLLYNPEQTGMVIDEMASFVYQPGQLSLVDADRAMWDYNPILARSTRYTNNSKNGTSHHFYDRASTKDFPGMMKIMKDYVVSRGAWMDRGLLTNEDNIPATPTATYTGAAGFPINGLTFQTSEFDSPIGAEFSAMEWRIAEITDPSAPDYDPFDRSSPRKYEIEATWESEPMEVFTDAVTVPGHLLQADRTYRLRVRMRDNDNHWSHWSEPVQFVAGPAVSVSLAEALRVSEVNYHPAEPTPVERAAGVVSGDEFEFIELINVSDQPIELAGAELTQVETNNGTEGVHFQFAEGLISTLQPGQRIVVVENIDAFQTRYGSDLPVAGQWSGRLSNGNELITLSAFGAVIQQFRYQDDWHPATDGSGATLEIIDAAFANLDLWNQPTGWQSSPRSGGSPGSASRIPGDANEDGRFDSSDIVHVFQAGKYEDDIPQNATWQEGDWNGDGDFDTLDMVFAFVTGLYEMLPGSLPGEDGLDP